MVAPLQVTGCWETVTALLVQPVVDPDGGSLPLQAETNDGSARASSRRTGVLIGDPLFSDWVGLAWRRTVQRRALVNVAEIGRCPQRLQHGPTRVDLDDDALGREGNDRVAVREALHVAHDVVLVRGTRPLVNHGLQIGRAHV